MSWVHPLKNLAALEHLLSESITATPPQKEGVAYMITTQPATPFFTRVRWWGWQSFGVDANSRRPDRFIFRPSHRRPSPHLIPYISVPNSVSKKTVPPGNLFTFVFTFVSWNFYWVLFRFYGTKTEQVWGLFRLKRNKFEVCSVFSSW